MLAERSGGDARAALSGLERAVERARGKEVDIAAIEDALQRRAIDYDRQGDRHYDFISAWIKATRGSDVDASLYYLAVMLEGGEDPRFIARRMVILASEDIGNADPMALLVADAAARAVDRVGLPECALNLSQATIYLALTPKSNAATTAIGAARAEVRENGAQTPPDYLRDAHYPGAEALGRGERLPLRARSARRRRRPAVLPDGARRPQLLRADRERPRGGSRRTPRRAAPTGSASPEIAAQLLAHRTGFSGAAFQAMPGRAVTPAGGSDWGLPAGLTEQGGEGAESLTRRPLCLGRSPYRLVMADNGGEPKPKKLRLGGMALRNGLLVHGPTHWAAAVRRPDGSIEVASERKPELVPGLVAKVPGLRGPVKLAEAMLVLPLVRRRMRCRPPPLRGHPRPRRRRRHPRRSPACCAATRPPPPPARA